MILKKKILSIWAILTLAMVPILTIATGSTGTTTGTSVVSGTTIPKVGHWQKAAGSKLTSGERGKFFQARNGDLYVMGKDTGLEVLKNGETTFKLAPGSITTNGEFGTIFQARNGDIYVMGKGTHLEVLKDGQESFQVVSSSNIDDGKEGTIFQTKNGDIYTMGISRKLQVLKNDAASFIDAPGSTITSGYESHFFESQSGDLYVAGWKTGLEVLKSGASAFTKASGSSVTNGAGMQFLEAQNGDIYVLHEKGLDVLKNGASNFITAPSSITTNGAFGTIFQTSSGDIYVMGHNTKLEVLKNGATDFTLAHGSHVNNGRDGRIFEARNGDLYVMGKGTGLEVLKKGTSTFASAPGSKIQNGSYGQFFEAQNGDLYVVSQYSNLEVLKYGADSFQRARGSKINTGLFAKIFQARNGDIYTMGYKAPLQVFKKGEDKFKIALGSNIKSGRLGRFFQARNGDIYAMGESDLEVLRGKQLEFALTRETSQGQNDGQIALTNYRNQFSKLQYRMEGSATWDDVPSNGIINSLSPGLYEFQWVAKDGFEYDKSTTSIEIIHEKQLIASAEVIDFPNLPTFTSTKETTSDANDGSITVTTFANADSQLQYRQTLIKDVWKDVPSSGQINDLSPGEYAFRWKSKNYQYYKGTTSTLAIIEQKQMVVSADTTNIPISPTFHKTDETIKGLNDGKIIVRNLLQKYPNLRLWYAVSWLDRESNSWQEGFDAKPIGANGIIEGLKTNGEYYAFPKFAGIRYDGISSSGYWLTEKEVEDIFKFRRIDTEYDKEQNPTKYKVILKSYFEENDHWLQYKETSSSKWKNVLSSGIIDNLSPGTYQFRWKSKKMHTYEGTLQPTKLIEESFTISEGTNILVPPLPNFQITPGTTSGGNNGIITITNFIDANSKLQYRSEGTSTWTDVPSNGIIDSLNPGGYEFQWTSKNSSELYDETRSNTYALKKQVVPSHLDFEISKFNDFSSSTPINKVRRNMQTKGNNDIKDDFINIPGYNAPSLASGVSIKKVVVFEVNWPTVTYTITLGKTGTSDVSKNVVVTYKAEDLDFSFKIDDINDVELSKFSNFDSNTPIHLVPSHMKTKGNKDIKDDFIKINGYIAPNLSEIFISKVTVFNKRYNDHSEEAIVDYQIVVENHDYLFEKYRIVSVSYKIDLNFEVAKFNDFESTRPINAVPANMKTPSKNNIKDDFTSIPGFIVPNLESGVAIKKVVVLDISNRVVTYKVTLGKESWSSEIADTIDKNIAVTYGEDTLSAAIAKFVDFSSTRAINAVPSNMKTASPDDIKEEFARIPGYNSPSLATGIYISKVVVKTPFDESTRQVVYTLTVSDGTNDEDKDVTITFAPDWNAELAKLNNFESPDTIESAAAILKAATSVDVKDEFEGITKPSNGYTKPSFSEGVAISKVVVKTELNKDTRQVVYTITLKNGNQDHATTKDVTVTFTHTLAEAKIAIDMALFTSFTQTLNDGVNRLANGIVTKDTLEGLSGHDPLPVATVGVTRTFAITTNPDGLATVTITFTSDTFDDTTNYEINNFKTTAQTNAEGAIAKDKTVLSNFGNQNVMGKPDSLVNGAINKETLESLNGHKKIPKAIANVNRAYRINTNLITGIATVTIDLTSGESPNQAFDTFTYTISSFKTQAEINETILETAVQALDVNGLNGKGDDTKLPSEISEATALSWIKALSSINGLADDVKNLLGEDDITLAFNDEEGILEITINNHGTPRTFRQISGFRVRTNSETLALVVQILDVNSLNGKGDSSKLPSEVKKATVLSWIKELSIINDLAKLIKDVKDLLLEDNIMLRSNDEEGSLVITINSHGDPKTFSKILGFKTNAKKAFEDTINVDKALFSDFDQTLTRRIEPLEDGVVTDLTLLTSNGHQALPSQTSGVSREFKIARATTGSATMTVIFKAGTGLNQVSDTITYKINGFKVITFQDFSSSTTYSSLARNLKTITNEILEKDVKTEFEKINDYATYNNVDSSVKLLKVEVVASDETQRQVTYKLTYTVSGGIEKQKDIAITFALDLDADAKKFKDFISSAQHSELKSTINVASGDTSPNVQADFIKIPGYVRPANLSADLSIKSVIVKTPYNASTRQVVYVVTITNGKEDKSFDLTVTFKPDFALERVKFKNFNSNLGTYSEIAIAPKSGNDVKALFEKIDGYVIPQNLATGVKIHQVVVNVALNIVTRQVIYSIRLWDGKNIDTNEYGIVVTFAKDLDAGAHQLSSFTSSDNVKSLAALLPQNDNNVKTTFEAISGFARPQLSKNVKIAKVVVKKALDAITRKVTFTITLAKTNQNDANATPTAKTKDVIVTFAPSLDEEAKKFNDFVSSDNVKSKAALLAQNSNDVKTTFEAISGYTKPVLTSGVQMSKAIVKKALSNSRVIFTITLTYEGDRKTKDITVTFKELSKTKSEGLSTGAIVGIAIGSIASLGILGYLIYYLMKRK